MPLSAGWSAVVYTGPDVTAATVAADLGADVLTVGDAATQQYDTFYPTLPAADVVAPLGSRLHGLYVKEIVGALVKPQEVVFDVPDERDVVHDSRPPVAQQIRREPEDVQPIADSA